MEVQPATMGAVMKLGSVLWLMLSLLLFSACGQNGFSGAHSTDSSSTSSSDSQTSSTPPPTSSTPPPTSSTPPPTSSTPPPTSSTPPVTPSLNVNIPSISKSAANINSGSELAAALAKGASSLVLASGSYGALTLTNKSYITIQSADPSKPASFDKIVISGGNHITLNGISVVFTVHSSDVDWVSAIQATNVQTLNIANCNVSNTLANDGGAFDGYSKGYPFWIRNSSDVLVGNCNIQGGHRGIMAVDGDRLTFAKNQITGFRAVGVAAGGCNSVNIVGNLITGANPYQWPKVDHGDFIHLWTDKVRGPSRDIQILDNWLDQGAGLPIMGPSLQTSGGHYFTNVTITNNLIRKSNNQALRLESVQNFQIVGNSMISLDPIGTKVVNVGGTLVPVSVGSAAVITGGVLSGIFDRNVWGKVRSSTGITLGNNLILKFSEQSSVLANPNGTKWSDFLTRPNGPGAGLGIH